MTFTLIKLHLVEGLLGLATLPGQHPKSPKVRVPSPNPSRCSIHHHNLRSSFP